MEPQATDNLLPVDWYRQLPEPEDTYHDGSHNCQLHVYKFPNGLNVDVEETLNTSNPARYCIGAVMTAEYPGWCIASDLPATSQHPKYVARAQIVDHITDDEANDILIQLMLWGTGVENGGECETTP